MHQSYLLQGFLSRCREANFVCNLVNDGASASNSYLSSYSWQVHSVLKNLRCLLDRLWSSVMNGRFPSLRPDAYKAIGSIQSVLRLPR